MITEPQIRRLMKEHVDSMDSSFGIDKIAASVSFMAGVIAVLKLQNMNGIRFLNIEKYEQ